jgi:hypothetical protein
VNQTPTIHRTALEAKVAARNRVNALAAQMFPVMTAALKPFIGKPILNQGAVLSARAWAALPDDDYAGKGATAPRWWFRASPYTVSVEFEVCELNRHRNAPQDLSLCTSQRGNASFCIAEIAEDRKTLKSVPETFNPPPTDYTAEGVEEARAEVRKARAVLEVAERALHGFGECDY